MKKYLFLLSLGLFGIISGGAAQRPNILFICVDDLRPELGCYGESHMLTPNIDKLASKGRIFTQHYVQVPTCGASRACLLTGKYPTRRPDLSNMALSLRYKKKNQGTTPSFPQLFKSQGYYTVSIGKVSHHPGGLMGKGWNDPKKIELPNAWNEYLMPCGEWKSPEGAMHGYAGGKGRTKTFRPLTEKTKGDDHLYPDGLIADAAVKHLNALSQQKQPWLLAVGFIKPHLPFAVPQKYWDLYETQQLPPVQHPEKPDRSITWSKSSEFFNYQQMGYNVRKNAKDVAELRRYYYACVSYSDAQVGKVLNALDKSGQAKNTIIVLWGDHGWNLGERAMWGKHNLYEEALRSPLIIQDPRLNNSPGKSTISVAETIDIYPTLCDLIGIKVPTYLDGASLKPQLLDPQAKTDGLARSFWGRAQSIRTQDIRLTRQPSKEEFAYNLFHFPETSIPTSREVKSAQQKWADSFLKPVK